MVGVLEVPVRKKGVSAGAGGPRLVVLSTVVNTWLMFRGGDIL